MKDKTKEILLDVARHLTSSTMTSVSGGLFDIVTTVGNFGLIYIRNKIMRTIVIDIGFDDNMDWLEDSLYAILSKYNNLNKTSSVNLNLYEGGNEVKLHSKFGDGNYILKYRKYTILLNVSSSIIQQTIRSSAKRTTYIIMTLGTGEKFLKSFEKDMLANRYTLMKMRNDRTGITISYFHDRNESWYMAPALPLRPFKTVYLENEKRKILFDTLNRYFSDEETYNKQGIPHNLKILLHGDVGLGKDSIIRAIATEYNRNIFYIKLGDGTHVPNALTASRMVNPLIVLSDIDRCEALINETDVEVDKDNIQFVRKDKSLFAEMLNALDGLTSGNHKIIIMTANDIGKFSPAFLRPGRIDLILELNPVIPEVFRKFVFDYYGKILPKDIKLKDDNIKIQTLQADVRFMKMSYEDFIAKYLL